MRAKLDLRWPKKRRRRNKGSRRDLSRMAQREREGREGRKADRQGAPLFMELGVVIAREKSPLKGWSPLPCYRFTTPPSLLFLRGPFRQELALQHLEDPLLSVKGGRRRRGRERREAELQQRFSSASEEEEKSLQASLVSQRRRELRIFV